MRNLTYFPCCDIYFIRILNFRYLSEGELLDNVNNAQGGGVGVSGSSDQLNSSSHLTGATGDAVSSPQRGNYYMWKPDPATSAGEIVQNVLRYFFLKSVNILLLIYLHAIYHIFGANLILFAFVRNINKSWPLQKPLYIL